MRQDYTRLAQNYDKTRFEGAAGTFLARADSAIIQSLFGFLQPRVVVDVPTGTGRVAKYLEHIGIRIIGCDVTFAMLNHVRAQNLHSKMDLIQCDASELPFRDSSVDCIICLRFFSLFPPSQRLLFVSEFRRILRPGGHIICAFTNALYAGGINWLRRAIGCHTLFFQEHGEIRKLFPHSKVLAVRGNYLPFQRHLHLLGGHFEQAGFHLTSVWPFNRLCWERFYLLEITG